MASQSYDVVAVLKAYDSGYSKAMKDAAKKADDLAGGISNIDKSSSTMSDTMKGMIGARGVLTLMSKAWDMIRDSIGKAVKRIDTMDQFRRVIELMTGDSEAAARAIDKINEAAKGTPYGLDVMSSAVQGLVTAGTELDSAIQYVEGWGNAVAVYSDGTNTSLESVTTAIGKMVSRGKVQMLEMNTLMQNGIPAMEIYAEATGQSTADVAEQMGKGGLAADDFMAAMDKAFTEGTEKFPALNNAAKEAGSSWAGTFDNMKAAVTRGVQAIIERIETARAEAGLPTMKDTIAEFGKAVEKVLKKVADIAGWVAANFDLILDVVTAVAAAWIGYSVIPSILTTVTTAINAMSAAAASNPAGLIAIGVTAAVIAAKQFREAYPSAMEVAAKTTDEYIKRLKETNKWVDANAKKGEGFLKVRKQEVDATDSAVAKLKLYETATKNGLNRSSEMKAELEKLKKIYPELEYEIDETTGALHGGVEGLKAFIAQQQSAADQSYYTQYLAVLQDEHDRLTRYIEETEIHMNSLGDSSYEAAEKMKLQAVIDEGRASLELLVPEIENTKLALGEAEIAVEASQTAYDAYITSLEGVRAEYGLQTTAIVEYANIHGEELDKVAEQAAEYASEFGISSDEVIEAALRQGKKIKDWATDLKKDLDRANKAFDGHVDNTLNGWKRLEQGSTISLDTYLDNMRFNQDATKNWAENTEKLMRMGIEEGVIRELGKLGVQGAAQAQLWIDELEELNNGQSLELGNLTDAASAKMDEIASVFAKGMEIAGEAARVELAAQQYGDMGREPAEKIIEGANSKLAALMGAGSNSGQSFYDGLMKWKPRINTLARELGTTVEKGIRSALQMRSPSRIMKVLAQDTGAGYINELIKQIDEVERLSMAFGAAVVPDIGMVDREINKATVSVAQDVSVVQRQSATFNLTLGNRTFRAFVDDISGEQSRTAELEEVYAV